MSWKSIANWKLVVPSIALTGVLVLSGGKALASSHSDAPLIKQDPQANLTDVYAFVGANNGGVKVLNAIINVRPFCEPGDGAIYDRFADDALYSINIASAATGQTVMTYNFRFSPVSPLTPGGNSYKNLDTVLSYGRGTAIGPIQVIGDAQQNFTQSYTVTRVNGGTTTVLNGGQTLIAAPPNVGMRTTPLYNDATGRAVSGATSTAALDPYTRQAVYNLPSGETTFAGMREDSFFMDIPGIFDLLNPRIVGPPGAPQGLGQTGNGTDGFKGYNVLTYGIQIPISTLSAVPGFPEVGVFASVSRQRVRLLTPGIAPLSSGPWVQVNRLANPLFNEGLVALRDKDRYNFALPTSDQALFSKYALAPELIHLINVVFSTKFQETNRTDLAGIYIPDVIKVDTSTPPVPLAGQPGFNRLSFIGGDTVTGASGQVPGGWPNGRRFGDDVADIALTAIASGPTFSTITLLGDNINANDQVYNMVFPYAGTPNSGTLNRKDPVPGSLMQP